MILADQRISNFFPQSKPKAIFFSAHLPAPTIPAAGQNLAYHNLVKLAESHDVILISFVNSNEQSYLDLKNYEFCFSVRFFSISLLNRISRAFLFLALPFKTAVRYDLCARRTVAKIFTEYHIELFHAEYTSVASYISLVPDGVASRIVSHDVVFQSYERFYRKNQGLVRWLFGVEFLRQRRWEIASLKKFDLILVLNEKDKSLLADFEVTNVDVQYPVVPRWISQVSRDHVLPYTLMFVGALNRKENEDAVLFFLDFVFPLVVAEIPESVFYIVGASPSRNILARSSKRVKVTGYQESLLWYFEHCQLAVAPLRYGAGIKIKVLETLAAGMTTICTDVGAEGVRPHPKLVISNNHVDMSRIIVSEFKSFELARKSV